MPVRTQEALDTLLSQIARAEAHAIDRVYLRNAAEHGASPYKSNQRCRRPAAPARECADAQMHRRAIAPTRECADARTRRCVNAPTHLWVCVKSSHALYVIDDEHAARNMVGEIAERTDDFRFELMVSVVVVKLDVLTRKEPVYGSAQAVFRGSERSRDGQSVLMGK